MAAYVLLALNGLELDAPEPEAADTIRSVASGEIGEEVLSVWIRDRARAWPG